MNKLLVLAAAALVGSAPVASAENHFSLSNVQDRNHTAVFQTIRTDGPGRIEVYSLQTGKQGVLLGSRALRHGINTDVRVPLMGHSADKGLAVLSVEGEVVAMQEVRFRN
ncbi:hypothetical protein [Rubellimicrobium roseum]|uniref:Uncharacterized protein n=1 Tax=Rubellimicrobium roseum TaxID=687525 RepID=A0A5C4NAZ5_9RHOB|nr:hypothetical protein [Rubellimicrobium roseum]TNC65518.1 hypothetical protein FHG71_17450 [Rubellimicrobium roseum]